MMRCAALLAVLAWTGASAQPADTVVVGLDSLAAVTDSLALLETARADSLAAVRVAEGVALDSLLGAHPDVLARHIARARAAEPWWQRWAAPMGLGAVLLLLAGLGALASRRLRRDITEASADGGAAHLAMQNNARLSAQAVERADAAIATLRADVQARLGDLARSRDALDAQIAQTRNVLDRAERVGLFHAAFAEARTDDALAPPSPDSET